MELVFGRCLRRRASAGYGLMAVTQHKVSTGGRCISIQALT
jgi:hypothetical protein